jgi:hypothetical protein
MEKTNRKNHGYKVRESDHPDGKCPCLDKGQISDVCVENGVCPSLKIIAVYKGVRKEKTNIQKK